jgi:hypothetical protein
MSGADMSEAGMNGALVAPEEWQALSEQWRGQAVDPVDLHALRRQVRRRGLQLRAWLALEVALTVAILAAFARMAVAPGQLDAAGHALLAALAVVLVLWQAWSLWIRRRQLRDGGLDAAGLLALEIERARTTIRYWRWGMWSGVALWLLLLAAVVLGAPPDSIARGVVSLPALLVNGATFAVAGVFAWWLGRHCRRRIRVLQQLQTQLDR